jgi:polyhydroxybutyrate depolymerase
MLAHCTSASRGFFQRIVLVVAAFASSSVACSGARRGHGTQPGAETSEAGERVVEIASGGRTRRYLLHVPASGSAPSGRPLVLSLHGAGGSGAYMAKKTGFSALADRDGFVVAYPDGIDHRWNDGHDPESPLAKDGIDDVGFLLDVLADIAKKTAIDPTRIYVNGMSNGAFMTSRFACAHADRVAAIGLVVGTMGPEQGARCAFAKPVSVIGFMGTRDPIVPYEGGDVRLGPFVRGRTLSAAEAFRVYSTLDSCAPSHRQDVPDLDPRDGSRAHVDVSACRADTRVELYSFEGAGHTWPGGEQYMASSMVGTVNRDVDASATMWAFFTEHGRK